MYDHLHPLTAVLLVALPVCQKQQRLAPLACTLAPLHSPHLAPLVIKGRVQVAIVGIIVCRTIMVQVRETL